MEAIKDCLGSNFVGVEVGVEVEAVRVEIRLPLSTAEDPATLEPSPTMTLLLLELLLFTGAEGFELETMVGDRVEGIEEEQVEAPTPSTG